MPKDLAALLLEDGAVSAEAVARAQARQREAGGALDTALLEVGALSEDALVAHLTRAAELPPAPAGAWAANDPRARRVFPSRVAERHGLAPFALEGRALSLVATHPVDVGLLDEISFMLSLDLKAHVAPEWRVRELIHRLYGTPLPPRLAALAAAGGAPADPAHQESAPREAAPSPPPLAPEPTGFARDDSEPREPLAAALRDALESIDPSLFEDDGGGAYAEEPEREGPPPDRSAPPRWSLDEARAALAAAQRRDHVVLVALRYARDFFEYAAMFAVARDAVAGHDALGAEDERDRARSVAIYAADPGIFRTVIETSSPYLGPVSRDAQGNAAILDGLGRGSPRTVLVHPVLLRDRPVCILYADNGEAPVSARRLGDLLLLLSIAGPAFERIIRDRKKRRRGAGAPPAPEPQAGPAAASASAPAPEPVPAPPAPEAIAAPPRPAPDPVPAEATLEPPEPAPSPPEAEPAPAPRPPEAEPAPEDVPDAAAAAPTPAALEDAPRVDDVRIEEDVVERASTVPVDGEPVAAAVAPSQTVADSLGALEEQFFFGAPRSAPEAPPRREEPPPAPTAAAPTPAPAPAPSPAPAPAAAPADPPTLSALVDGALGANQAAASEACAALAERRRDPAIRPAMEKLRRALLSGLSGRPARAARAIGAVRDVDAIPLLIQVLEVSEPETAAAAADALAAITLQRLGPDARRWLGWWKQNRGRGRAEWLFSGLTSADRETRVAASTELAHAAPPPVAYSADAPPPERERIARAWAGWWARSGHVL